MPAFLQKMMNANQTMIAGAKGEDVHVVPHQYVMERRMKIPIFQRRYCWGKEQWNTLFGDVLAVVSADRRHQLGRLTCAVGSDGRLLVVDGQQRCTTVSLLLAALRDAMLGRGGIACAEAAALDAVLFPDAPAMEAWISSGIREGGERRVIPEGEVLPFAALWPTYCDRASYYAAVLPPRAEADAGGDWNRPMEAKQYFLDKICSRSMEELVAIAGAVLSKLEWLFFPIDLAGGHDDGTDDLQIIFERLALRDATFCRPKRKHEFADMGAADFVRNLLLGSFQREADAIEMYKQHWLPIECAAAAAMDQTCSSVATLLEDMLTRFLDAPPQRSTKGAAIPPTLGPIGGKLYARFRSWLTAELCREQGAASCDAEEMERRTAEVLCRLKCFAMEHFATESRTGLEELQEAEETDEELEAQEGRLQEVKEESAF